MRINPGSTNVSVYFYIVQDASATSPGEPVTGLLFSDIETGGSASYARQGAARVDLTLITLASASAAHADGGFILVDDTNMPGVYRCDYADATFATGVDAVTLQIVVASANNAVASPIFVDMLTPAASLTAGAVDDIWDEPLSGHSTAGTAGWNLLISGSIIDDTTITGTPTTTTIQLTAGSTLDNFYNDQLVSVVGGTGAGQVRPILAYEGSTKTITVDEVFVTTPASGDRVVVIFDHVHPISQIQAAILSDATPFAGASIASILTDTAEIGTAGAGLTNINLPNQTMDIIGSITGNISGSVGSVTGAVGSVTAAVTTGTINADVINAASIAASAMDGKGDWLLASGYTAPDNTGIGAIQIQTDKLTFTVANQLDGNIQYVNDVQVTGDGGSGSEWGPV